LTCGAYVNGVKINVKFDTGAPVSILSLAAAKRAEVTPASVGVKSIGATSGIGGGLVKQWLAPLAMFSIGGETNKNTQVTIADFRSDTLRLESSTPTVFHLHRRVGFPAGGARNCASSFGANIR
jgi:hypothetical protein